MSNLVPTHRDTTGESEIRYRHVYDLFDPKERKARPEDATLGRLTLSERTAYSIAIWKQAENGEPLKRRHVEAAGLGERGARKVISRLKALGLIDDCGHVIEAPGHDFVFRRVTGDQRSNGPPYHYVRVPVGDDINAIATLRERYAWAWLKRATQWNWTISLKGICRGLSQGNCRNSAKLLDDLRAKDMIVGELDDLRVCDPQDWRLAPGTKATPSGTKATPNPEQRTPLPEQRQPPPGTKATPPGTKATHKDLLLPQRNTSEDPQIQKDNQKPTAPRSAVPRGETRGKTGAMHDDLVRQNDSTHQSHPHPEHSTDRRFAADRWGEELADRLIRNLRWEYGEEAVMSALNDFSITDVPSDYKQARRIIEALLVRELAVAA